jgi:hypothetical protein
MRFPPPRFDDAHTEHAILAALGDAAVLAAHRTVRWADGSELDVHRVMHARSGECSHLALREPRSQAWLVFEVRTVDPELAADLRRHAWADAGALIHFNCRHHFASAYALVRAVLQQQTQAAVAGYQFSLAAA